MEPAPLREQVHDFTRACQALIGFAHAHKGLTDLERETVRTFVLKLEEEVGPYSLQSSTDDSPLGGDPLKHL